MVIDSTIFDSLLAQAGESPRLRMNRDLRNSAEDGSQRMLNAILLGSHLPVHRHRASSETVVCLKGRLDEVFSEVVEECEAMETSRCVDYGLDPGSHSYPVMLNLIHHLLSSCTAASQYAARLQRHSTTNIVILNLFQDLVIPGSDPGSNSSLQRQADQSAMI